MSTRTSIRIGSLIDNSMKLRFPGYERFLEEFTNQYLLFAYRKKVHKHYYASVLFQAGKTFGGLTCEVGVSRTEAIPYYRYYDSPRLGVNGFRARTMHVLKGLEANTTRQYTGPDSLMGVIIDLVDQAQVAGKQLLDEAMPVIAEQYQIWQPLYSDWLEAEKTPSPNPDRRYPNLVGEAVARRILHNCLREGKFDSFLGPNKFKYRQPEFMNCHAYLLARSLEFVEPPEPEEMKRIEMDPENPEPDKILFDGISALSGRAPQDEAVELSPRILDRVPEWAFLRSFAALEALFEKEVVDLSVVKTTTAPVPKKEEVIPEPSLSLDELYSDAPDLPPLEGSLDGAPAAQAKRTERPDPFESIERYVSGEIQAVQAEEPSAPDPFDMLGSQLGL